MPALCFIFGKFVSWVKAKVKDDKQFVKKKNDISFTRKRKGSIMSSVLLKRSQSAPLSSSPSLLARRLREN